MATLTGLQIHEALQSNSPLFFRDVIRTPYHRDDFYARMMDYAPAPHVVRYVNGRHHHVPPDRFWFGPVPAGPSDCVWIVPGTAS